ncbi:M28 family peptidase [Chloroflexia bacterium SDU3-3]|nr:M28 family peptidase [Chloroflexia bacterium SDU3-3]
MSDLHPEALYEHVKALATTIGPRPTGSLAEAKARDYIRTTLAARGIATEEIPFLCWDTWGYTMCVPAALVVAATILGRSGRLRRLAGAATAAYSVYHMWQSMLNVKQPMRWLFPKVPTATTVARIPAQQQAHRRVVLIGHTDSNKQRPSFTQGRKKLLQASSSVGFLAHALAAAALLAQSIRPTRMGGAAQAAAGLVVGGFLAGLAYDELAPFVPGAQDNATAVACLLGLGAHIQTHPLEQTEVWLAFTGAEESSCMGTHALLDQYGDELRDAYFIDFELVGSSRIAYVTRHSGITYFTPYAPDADSLALARAAAERSRQLGVTGQPVVIVEEVASLRRRGFRGICLVGLDAEGWLPHWHQATDDADHIDPEGLATASQFALAMIQELDGQHTPLTEARKSA